MRSETEIRAKIQALKDIEKSKDGQDTISKAILAGSISALEWVLSNNPE